MPDDGRNAWDLSEASRKLGELVERAQTEGPQTLAVGGEEAAAVISMSELNRLRERKPTFKEFLLSFPSLDGLDLERDATPPRDIDL
ncbi:MAG TPA: type II toxin-antitoxin system Phd/YefM family antitoxin [Caulobacteraceae bacterium]|jgi:prevent-host-death family protein